MTPPTTARSDIPLNMIILLLLLLCVFPTPSSGGSLSRSDEEQIQNLKRIAYGNPEGPQSEASFSAWRRILEIDPRNLEAHVILGDALLSTSTDKTEALYLLESSFDPAKVSPTIDYSFVQAYILAATIGRYRSQRKEYASANKLTRIALELSERHAKAQSEKTCLVMQLASMFDFFPESEDHADKAIDLLTSYADIILADKPAKNYWPIRDHEIIHFPGAAPDPFLQCLLGPFSLSFYYRADVAAVARKQYEMAIRGWPALAYTADFVRRYDKEAEHPCVNRKIRLAVISGVLTHGHSNSESFGGVLSRLDRNIFEVTYVLLAEKGADIASFTRTHPSDQVYIWGKEAGDVHNGAWTLRWAKEIESWEMDIIFYFELSMSTYARRLGMARLAPVQANSIGHPITSGHDRSVTQYYISWAAAELPLEVAQTHYTEELKLLPSDIVYQYYEPRLLSVSISRMNGQWFGNLKRGDFGLPSDARVYVCMQKPLKFHPDFDKFLCGIMKKDREGRLAIHKEDNAESNQIVFRKRLKRAGCDLSRVTFLDMQEHHRLLALYRDATVVLDSYPAGGDTTTREVIEMGKPLVTLPARLLGGRWTLGYLSNIGLKESTKEAMIATDTEDYVDKAVRLANDDALRKSVEDDLKACAPNLFYRDEAVAAWQKMFLEISPYRQCQRRRMRKEEL